MRPLGQVICTAQRAVTHMFSRLGQSVKCRDNWHSRAKFDMSPEAEPGKKIKRENFFIYPRLQGYCESESSYLDFQDSYQAVAVSGHKLAN